jgi:hypothetical protein
LGPPPKIKWKAHIEEDFIAVYADTSENNAEEKLRTFKQQLCERPRYLLDNQMQFICFPKNEFDKRVEDSFWDLYYEVRAVGTGVFHAALAQLVNEGVIKKSSFISFLVENAELSRKQAIEFIAKWYGMMPSTQSVYGSDEFTARENEKSRSRKKKGKAGQC